MKLAKSVKELTDEELVNTIQDMHMTDYLGVSGNVLLMQLIDELNERGLS